jgi:hypothetical protein
MCPALQGGSSRIDSIANTVVRDGEGDDGVRCYVARPDTDGQRTATPNLTYMLTMGREAMTWVLAVDRRSHPCLACPCFWNDRAPSGLLPDPPILRAAAAGHGAVR